jgi:NAD(P)-dependent dehydrogenase (short-subunit alcohol dehydrogenase family)
LSSAIQRLRAGSKQSAPTNAESKMDLGIAGLRVIVTAGAAGIGREVAGTFMREGARVYVCDVDQTAVEALATSDPKLSLLCAMSPIAMRSCAFSTRRLVISAASIA